MRVIAGSARSLPLKTPAGLETRPTTDRIKETLFNMIQSGLYGCRFLDLYSGSGAIGIEALSRGAQKAVFVEQQKKALSCIRENLAFTHLDGVVMGSSVEAALPRLEAAKEYGSSIWQRRRTQSTRIFKPFRTNSRRQYNYCRGRFDDGFLLFEKSGLLYRKAKAL